MGSELMREQKTELAAIGVEEATVRASRLIATNDQSQKSE